jgi:hypothetical protein
MTHCSGHFFALAETISTRNLTEEMSKMYLRQLIQKE